jgi:hypothetical protein
MARPFHAATNRVVGVKVLRGPLAALAALIVVAGAFAGCGDDTTTTVTETTAVPSTTSSTTSTDSTTTEDATTIPDQEYPAAGETADLPLCSEGPPPCREDDTGAVIAPGEGGDGGGVVAP